ncbi:MAG: helix-turn-helix transcriptional regulator [Bacteroidia bacterium]|nr:helix-turn-helix transcriptional regulator [Bacteroidia bacterium]
MFMILQQLPDPAFASAHQTVPRFADHVLFSERILRSYEYPAHTAALGLLSLAAGDGAFFINKKRHHLSANQFLVVNNASELALKITTQGTEPSLLFFHADLPAIVADSVSQKHEALMDNYISQHADFSLLERVQVLGDDMRSILAHLPLLGASCASFHALKADLLVRHLLEMLCLRNTSANHEANQIRTARPATRRELYRRLAIVRDWIHAHYAEHITLDDMGGLAAMNSQHFMRMFSQAFGKTPYQYLGEVRLARAKELLLNTDLPVSAITEAVGFESLSYFSWLFKTRTGCSPSAFRAGK